MKIALRLGVLAALLCLAIRPGAAQGQTLDLERIQSATVFIMQTRNVGSSLMVTCVSSGTVVSRDGLVLTNAHATVPSAVCNGETLIIAFSVRAGEPPIPKYRAEISQADIGLDLALLRITRQFDGRLVSPGSLALPFVELADSGTVRLDQTITVVGYPDIGNDPVEVRRGTVSGFVAEPRGGDRAWIKTLAEIPGTMSGGGAYDQDGRLIGVPTTAPISGLAQGTSCVPVQDTNSDGLVNAADICIPVGGFINSLRPSNFARPLLRAAALGLKVDLPALGSGSIVPAGQPAFNRLFFAPSVNEAGVPTSVIRSLPAGSTSLYLFFDYANMTPETVYELRVTTDGIPNRTFSLAPVRWSGGERGLWHIGSVDQPWPNGVYDFTLFADGITSGTARLLIGGAAEPVPTFSDIVFGLQDSQGTPLGNGFVLPTGSVANARFIYRNMQAGLPWTVIWYYGGVEVRRDEQVWSDGTDGAKTIGLEGEGGLFPGAYRLEMYIENRLAATADFTIAGAQQGVFPQVFSNVRFATAPSLADAASAPAGSTFPAGINTLYGLFDWQQIQIGTLWTLRLSVDDSVFYERTAPWTSPESGANFVVRMTDESGIPDGTYRLDLLVNNVPLQSARAQVGIGQLPIDRFASASGVQVRGQIIDAETREGVPGVSFILLTKDYSVADFEWRADQVFALAVTDRSGRFQVDRPLELAAPYSVIITAAGYLPVTVDGFEVDGETANPLELVIYLTRG